MPKPIKYTHTTLMRIKRTLVALKQAKDKGLIKRCA